MKKILLVAVAFAFAGALFSGSLSRVSADDPVAGCEFNLFGSAENDVDPENPNNEVISIDPATTGDFGGVRTTLPTGTQATDLDNQVSLQYFHVAPKTCTAGSPRVQLRIDNDGDGDGDFNAFGYIGEAPFGAGCTTGSWNFDDMTDNVGRWDLSQGGGGMTLTWDQMEAFLAGTYANYQIITGSVVDDGYLGKTYFDNITFGDCTLTGEATPPATPTPTPTATPTATPTPSPTPMVGPPTNADQCKNGGWETFNTPRTFKNQGDCIQFVKTGK